MLAQTCNDLELHFVFSKNKTSKMSRKIGASLGALKKSNGNDLAGLSICKVHKCGNSHMIFPATGKMHTPA